jgi:methionyl aminopeptidase
VVPEASILSVDIGVELNGYCGDMAVTHPVGRIDKESQRLIDVTRRALAEGIEQVEVGNRLSDIARAIQEYVEARGFSVVREYVGHGIGREMHEPPQVPNFWDGDSGPDRRLREGMVLAIEPMVNRGTWKTRRLRDRWTVVTDDGERSAHFEHTVAVLKDGPEILTQAD